MTTKEAFEKLIGERGWYTALGLGDSTARSYAKRFRENKLPAEKIEEILEKAGFKVKQEKLWEMANEKPKNISEV